MLKSLFSAFLVFRLELHQIPVNLEAVLMAWLRRPVIEIVLPTQGAQQKNRQRLHRKLDEVYPF